MFGSYQTKNRTMLDQIFEPNRFELLGRDIHINYSPASFLGGAQLEYTTQNVVRQFGGREIRALVTDIGILVTVLVETNFHAGKEVRLALLLPMINLPSSQKTRIETQATLTTHLTRDCGNFFLPSGQLQSYETLSLTGTASYVSRRMKKS